MKPIKQFSLFVLMALTVTMLSCGEEDVQTNYSNVSGTITYDGGTPAGGAYVYLGISGGTAADELVAVTDANGNYNFSNVEEGDYYIYSNYNTSNQPAGRVSGFIFLSTKQDFVVGKEDVVQDIALENSYSGDNNSIQAGIDEFDNFKVDYSHSNVNFEFDYHDAEGQFTGRFGSYELTVDLDDSDLGSSSITAAIDVTSINTGQPGRDNIPKADGSVGCIQRSQFGTFNDLDSDGIYDGESELNTDFQFATFTSNANGIEFYGDGYKATGMMNWIQHSGDVIQAYSEEVVVYFKYNPGYVDDARHPSLEAKLVFSTAQGSFFLDSGNVGEQDVEVYVTVQLDELL